MNNITNLQSAGDVDTVIRQQGWSLDSYIAILSDFITANQLWPQVLAYMQQRAAQENEDTGA